MRLEIESNVASLPFLHDGAADHASVSNPEDVDQCMKQGIAAAQSGDRVLARTLLMTVTEAEPGNLDAWLWLASISEYPEELLGFLSRVLEIDPVNQRACEWEAATRSLLAKTFVQRGITANSAGQSDFAMHCFDRAIGYDVRCESAWFWKSSMAKDSDDREVFLARVLEINPDNADAQKAMSDLNDSKVGSRLNAARAAAFGGNALAAEEVVDMILDRDPDNVTAWLLRSQIAFSFEEKLEAYRRASEIDPENAFARSGFEFLTEAKALANPAAEPEELQPELSVEAHHVDEHDESAVEMEAVAEEETASAVPAAEPVVAYHERFSLRYNPELGERDTDENLHQYLTQDSYNLAEDEAPVSPEPEQVLSNEAFTPKYEDEPVAVAHFEDEDRQEVEELTDLAIHDTVPANVGHYEEIASPSFEESVAELDPFQTKVTEAPYFSEVAEPEHTEEVVESLHADDLPAIFDQAIAAEPVMKAENACPFCTSELDPQAFACNACGAFLSLSDLESLFGDSNQDRQTIQDAVTKMEGEWNLREFSEVELAQLGIGHFNLHNYDKGLAYLQEAATLNPNNVILVGQVNAIAIRMEDLRRQVEYHESLPKGRTILVVDDSATVRKLISSKLEKCGHKVLTAVDGVEAMEVIEEVVPDLVLLDIAMPRMDGYSVCKLIRAKETVKNVPVVMISGKDGFFDKVRGRMAGTTGYITKPFGPETLMRALETYLLPDQVEN